MTAGLPGTGLGGVFYLLSALWMPMHQLIRTWRGLGGGRQIRLIVRQVTTATLMIASLVATGRALGWLLGWRAARGLTAAAGSATTHPELLRTGVLLLTAGALAVLLTIVELASLLLRRGSARRSAGSVVPAAPRGPERHAA